MTQERACVSLGRCDSKAIRIDVRSCSRNPNWVVVADTTGITACRTSCLTKVLRPRCRLLSSSSEVETVLLVKNHVSWVNIRENEVGSSVSFASFGSEPRSTKGTGASLIRREAKTSYGGRSSVRCWIRNPEIQVQLLAVGRKRGKRRRSDPVVGSRASGPCLVLRASPVVRVCYGIVLRRSWVGSVCVLRSPWSFRSVFSVSSLSSFPSSPVWAT